MNVEYKTRVRFKQQPTIETKEKILNEVIEDVVARYKLGEMTDNLYFLTIYIQFWLESGTMFQGFKVTFDNNKPIVKVKTR